MKRIAIITLRICMLISFLVGCGNQELEQEKVTSSQTKSFTTIEENEKKDDTALESSVQSTEENVKNDKKNVEDVDLTVLSSTMVYSEVYNMMALPEDYIGRKVKMKGQFTVYQDTVNNKNYFAVVIADAASCCQQGFEFVLEGDYQYPDDYPKEGTEITVTGIFDTYEEDGNQFCHLIGSEMEIGQGKE